MSTKEQNLVNAGPIYVINSIKKDGSDLKLHILAQMCGMAARAATEQDAALAWTDAAIAAYDSQASALSDSLVRNGLEIVAFGLRGAAILRFGMETKRAAEYLAETERWLVDGLRGLESPDQLRTVATSMSANRKQAMIGLERLRTFVGLWNRGLLQRELDPWFCASIGVPHEPRLR